MKTVYLAQVNNSYGDNAFLPYSVGLLWSYSMTSDAVRAGYQLGGMIFLREDLDTAVDKIDNPDVLALSCYIWNWSYNLRLASAVKSRYPGCIVILGGPEVPNLSDGFFSDHWYADILVHGEGEVTMMELLIELLEPNPNLGLIDGISYRGSNGETIKTKPRNRLSDLDLIPSPYTIGLFDEIVKSHPDISFNASQETHRGCPYSCTFCDWGSAVMTKVRQFGTDRLVKEMRWFGENRVDLLYNCDANYGIMKRDIELTSTMIDIKHQNGGYPSKFRAAYAKKSNDRVFEIAMMLNEAGMNKGVTLSMQSIDTATLENVKRSNIRMDDFARLIATYRKHGIPTYTELIIGLPGETLDSLINGFDEILKAGQHDNINAYMCMILKNSEMADKRYMEKHGMVSKRVPLLSLHGTPAEMGIKELNDIVVSTNTMPYADWKKANVLAWMVQCMHCLGLTQFIAMDYHRCHGTYMGFYIGLHDTYIGTDTTIGRQLSWVYDQFKSVFEESSDWALVDPTYGDISWPLEEYSFLQLLKELDSFYEEMKRYAITIGMGEHLDDMIDFQRNLLIKPFDRGNTIAEYDFDLASSYHSMQSGIESTIDRRKTLVSFSSDVYFDDVKEYAKHVVWYGRKAGKTKRLVRRQG